MVIETMSSVPQTAALPLSYIRHNSYLNINQMLTHSVKIILQFRFVFFNLFIIIIIMRNIRLEDREITSRLFSFRIITIVGEIDSYMSANICSQLFLLSAEGKNEIVININSPGGEIDSGLAIYDVMRLLIENEGIEIKTVVMGMAASMGSVILLGGKVRCALKHSKIMVHQPHITGFQADVKDMRVIIKEMEGYLSIIRDLFKEHCNLTDLVTDQMFNDRDYFMTSQEALKHGVVHNILPL